MDSATVMLKEAGDGDEEALVVGILKKDAHAFETLMRRYNRRLYRTARSILKDDAEAEDALQEAYWKAYKAMDRFQFDARLSTWLTRIVINESLSRLRQSRRRGEFLESCEVMAMDKLNVKAETIAAREQRPDAMTWRTEIRTLIEEKLDNLPDAYRTIFMLRAVEEMPVSEVAAALEIPEATVRTRFFRARRLMREALVDEIDTHAGEAFSFDGARCDRIVANVLARFGR
ncbi:MAG TPA: RNA polymerase sigma factor [Pusillimonas sp.]|uniref:RNA polymerase sigma factor n=1 Tax=Pusillimonas sp. TaxID=3040095 RepID=UPI002D085E36|nr:RNA polymerase sigma factor [Pusillimonas sp.]HUH87448.1 RNA polymerase sigma factor [Pusillimonas sp.]